MLIQGMSLFYTEQIIRPALLACFKAQANPGSNYSSKNCIFAGQSNSNAKTSW